jgi:hypothetical protein
MKTSSHRSAARRFARDNRGATMVEYGLMLTLVLVLGYVGYVQLGKNVRMSGDKATVAFAH